MHYSAFRAIRHKLDPTCNLYVKFSGEVVSYSKYQILYNIMICSFFHHLFH